MLKKIEKRSSLTILHVQHLSISLEYFVGGERLHEVIVQVAAVRALLDVAVLGEILHPDSDVHHRLPAVLTVETSLRTHREDAGHSGGRQINAVRDIWPRTFGTRGRPGVCGYIHTTTSLYGRPTAQCRSAAMTV